MTSTDEWNDSECPHCGEPLMEGDMARIAAQAKLTEVGAVTFMEPHGWWELACGHRVESVTHRTDDGFNFKLIDRPRR